MFATSPTRARRFGAVLLAVSLLGCDSQGTRESGVKDRGTAQYDQGEVSLSPLNPIDPALDQVRVTPTSEGFYELAWLLERHRVFLYLVRPEYLCEGWNPSVPPAMLDREQSAAELLRAMANEHDAQLVQVKNAVGLHYFFYRAAPDAEIAKFRDALAMPDAELRNEVLRSARFTHDLRIVSIAHRYLRNPEKAALARNVLQSNVGVVPAALLLPEKDAIAFLQNQLKDGDRFRAAGALGRIGGDRALELLTSTLDDPDPKLRLAAVKSLRFIPGTTSLKSLGSAITDESTEVREAVAEAFSWSVHRRAFAGLARLTADKQPSVRLIAASALGWHGTAAVELLAERLKDENSEVRGAAALSLGKIPSREAARILGRALRDKDYMVREQAGSSLGSIGDPFAIEVLKEAARAEAKDTRWAATGALGRIHSDASFALLAKLIDDPEIDVQSRAVYHIGGFDEQSALPVLKEAMETHSCCHVQSAAATALGEIGGEAAVSMLAELLDKNSSTDDWHVRRTIAHALGAIHSDSAIRQLERILRQENPRSDAGNREAHLVLAVRRGAINALGGSGHPSAVSLLERELQHADRSVRQDAINALARIGGPVARDILLAHENQFPTDSQVVRQALRDWLVNDPKVRAALGFEP